MDFLRPLRKLPGSLLLAVIFAPAAGAAESVPAYPAALDCASAECPDTVHATQEVTFISRHAFPSGNARLTRDAKRELQRMLAELESFATVRHIEIIGHADPSGPENYNRWLSEIRAKRVQRYLAQSGVDPRVISLRAAGSREPLAGAIDSAEHRRIEIRITLQPFF